MALSLPLVLFLLDWFLRRRFGWRLILEKALFIWIVFPIAWLTYAMNMRAIEPQFPQAILTWVWCLFFYLAKFIFPFGLLVLYQVPQPVSLLNPEFLSAIVFLSVAFCSGVFFLIHIFFVAL
jgi:hypothetical protein